MRERVFAHWLIIVPGARCVWLFVRLSLVARVAVYMARAIFFCREEEETVGLILYGKGEGFGMAGVM